MTVFPSRRRIAKCKQSSDLNMLLHANRPRQARSENSQIQARFPQLEVHTGLGSKPEQGGVVPTMKSFVHVCISLIVLSATARVGHAAPTITVLHAFNGTDGSQPYAPVLQASDGNFYGTTLHGGDDGQGCAQGCDGAVFKITPQGQFTLLHTFVGGG